MVTSHWHAVLRIHLYLLSVAKIRSDSSKNKLHLCFSGSPFLHCWLQSLTQIVMAESLPFLNQTGRRPRVHLSPTLDLNLSYHEKPVFGRENTIFPSIHSTLSSTWGDLCRDSCLAVTVTFRRGIQPNSSLGLAEDETKVINVWASFSSHPHSHAKTSCCLVYTGSGTH